MDPTACLQRIYDANDATEYTAACVDLARWIGQDGALPDLTRVRPRAHRYANISPWWSPGTNTNWAISTIPAWAPTKVFLARCDNEGMCTQLIFLGDIPPNPPTLTS